MAALASLDEKLFQGSHDTTVIGWRDGQVVFLKSYAYDKQQDEAQSDLKKIIDAGLTWRIGHVTHLKFEEDDCDEDIELDED